MIAEEREQEGMAKRVNPVVELDTDQVEALFGKALNEGESATVTVTVNTISDAGNYELAVDREEASEEASEEDEDAEADRMLGYPRSKLFPKPKGPTVSASDLI